ncbi:tumor necrosis factor-like [Xyrauchen texanus]|uniref:tumor necrosis factor-like n=1 Tax=Xyrauchen texanus TaxID=154827 RepID=UPI002242BE6D|nr:tumor necrosis factor-like [Xyrauchen texanus]
MELGKEDIDILMEPYSVNSLKMKYRSLRRQMCFIQFITVLFCLTCCLFTLAYQQFASSCKENEIKKAPEIGMQRQTTEFHSRENITLSQRPTPFTRLTIKTKKVVFSGPGNVKWMQINLEPDHTEYFDLSDDGESLIVRRDGTYKVSLQIMYKGTDCDDETILQHEIRHYTESYPEYLLLLTYMETLYFKHQYWRKTLFSEGIFSLNSGDRLKVWSKDLSLIDAGGNLEQKTVFVAYPHFSI